MYALCVYVLRDLNLHRATFTALRRTPMNIIYKRSVLVSGAALGKISM